MLSTLTSKGQATIPKPIREYLGLHAGSRVEFKITADGNAIVKAGDPSHPRPVRSKAAKLRGRLKIGMSTDELMNLLRGYDEDADDPGFKGL